MNGNGKLFVIVLEPYSPLKTVFAHHTANAHLKNGLICFNRNSACGGDISIRKANIGQRQSFIDIVCRNCGPMIRFSEPYFKFAWALLTLQAWADEPYLREALVQDAYRELGLALNLRERIKCASNGFEATDALVEPLQNNPSLAIIGLKSAPEFKGIFALAQVVKAIQLMADRAAETAYRQLTETFIHTSEQGLNLFQAELAQAKLVPV